MPTYEYECTSCKTTQEVFQAIKDPNPNCEKCKKEMSRLISGAPMIRKGAGLYSIDASYEAPKMGTWKEE